MADNAKNFAKVEVSTGYDASAVSIDLIASDGAKLPTASFNAVWWNITDYPDPSDDPNVEIVRVTNIATDTLTITRAQEGTSATTKNTGGRTYKMIAGLTAKVINLDVVPYTGANATLNLGSENFVTTGAIVGIADGNLLDKSAAEAITGNWDFKETHTAAVNLVAGNLCYLNSSGKFAKVDANAEATSKGLLAIALATINTDATGSFLMKGRYTTSGLTTGAEYFISLTPAEWTSTKPSATADMVRLVGYALSTTILYFDPDKTYIEIT